MINGYEMSKNLFVNATGIFFFFLITLFYIELNTTCNKGSKPDVISSIG